jgi:hypothetical protein
LSGDREASLLFYSPSAGECSRSRAETSAACSVRLHPGQPDMKQRHQLWESNLLFLRISEAEQYKLLRPIAERQPIAIAISVP